MNHLKRRARRRVDGLDYARKTGASGNRRVRGRFYTELRWPPVTNNSIAGATNLSLNFQRGSRVYVYRSGGSGITIGNFSTPYQSAGTITANATKGQTTITTSASPLAPGFYWLGVGTTTHVSTPASDRSSGGEIIRVVSSVGTTATLDAPLLDDYPATSTILMLDNQGDRNRFLVRDVRIRGVQARGTQSTTGQHIAVSLGLNVTLENCDLRGALTQCALLFQIRGVNVFNVKVGQCGAGVGTGYGVAPVLSQRIAIRDVSAHESRHAVSFARQCKFVRLNGIGASASLNAVIDDHDGQVDVIAENIVSPTGSIVLGNTTWPLEAKDFIIRNFSVATVQMNMRRLNHVLENGSFVALQTGTTAGGRTTVTHVFQNVEFRNCNLTGSATLYPVDMGFLGSAVNHNLQGVQFTDCTINGTQTGPGHCIVFRTLAQSPTGFSFNLKLLRTTVTAGSNGGARSVIQTGTGTNPALTLDIENCTFNALVGAPTQTVLREAGQTGGTFTVVHSGSTFRGSAFSNANLSGVTGVIRT